MAVNAPFFYKINPNYSRPSLRDIRVKDKDRISVINISVILTKDRKREKEKIQGDSMNTQKLDKADLLISCPTVCYFSFKEKIFYI